MPLHGNELLCEADLPDFDDAPVTLKMFDRRSMAMSAGMLAAVPVGGYFIWWKGKDFTNLEVKNEGWFGPDTYAGGADKSGHLVATAIAGELMQRFYVRLGHSPSDARWLSIGVVALGGLMVEAGDGMKYGGASPEDAALNVTGAIIGAQIAYHGKQNLFGFRYGSVSNAREPRNGPRLEHYSREISAFDVKFAGLPESRLNRGPGRYLMLSLTYGSRGYHELPPEQRERNVGLEIGLNIPEVLRSIGVPERGIWWPLYMFFNHVRVPYTAIGFHYDLDHDRWHGPESR